MSKQTDGCKSNCLLSTFRAGEQREEVADKSKNMIFSPRLNKAEFVFLFRTTVHLFVIVLGADRSHVESS